jgi:hypothetical protein
LSTHEFRHLIFSPKVKEETFYDFLILLYKELKYSLYSLKEPSQQYLEQKRITLKRSAKKEKTLVLDLDETLLHSELTNDKYALGTIKIPDNKDGI